MVSTYGDVVAETFVFHPGAEPPTPLPKHAHDEYQLGLTLSNPGRYTYRGETHGVPPGTLTVLHPAEWHAVTNARPPDRQAEFRLLYAPASIVAAVAADLGALRRDAPFVRAPVVQDAHVVALFLRLHHAIMRGAPRLAQDALFQDAFSHLLVRYAERPMRIARATPARPAVEAARAYLREHAYEDVRLTDLARIADLSPTHLLRLFTRVTGLPPHAYQLAVRLAAAKRRLITGETVAQVAVACGFSHQSHFGAQFKRVYGVSPARYRAQQHLDRSTTPPPAD